MLRQTVLDMCCSLQKLWDSQTSLASQLHVRLDFSLPNGMSACLTRATHKEIKSPFIHSFIHSFIYFQALGRFTIFINFFFSCKMPIKTLNFIRTLSLRHPSKKNKCTTWKAVIIKTRDIQFQQRDQKTSPAVMCFLTRHQPDILIYPAGTDWMNQNLHTFDSHRYTSRKPDNT